jgi:hypothetical protein
MVRGMVIRMAISGLFSAIAQREMRERSDSSKMIVIH